jgi:hypothetical protein
MNADAPLNNYGPEYPAAIVLRGVRLPLVMESPFTRFYRLEDLSKGWCQVSRFMDGSSSISMEQLQNEWTKWTDWQREDFCQSFAWLHKQCDFQDMLRFIMRHGTSKEWATIAGLIATKLPCEEAFKFLLRELQVVSTGNKSSLIQAVAITKHPDVKAELRQQLQIVCDDPAMWDDDSFLNWVANDAEECIRNLIELGASPDDFENQVRRLSQHICARNRESCRKRFSEYYSWLKQENKGDA